MGTRFEVKGLKELQRSLQRLQNNARSLHGTHHVPISDVLTDAFIREHTRHQSVDQWFAASPFTIESQEDFQAIPDFEWDAYVKSSTRFATWEEMLSEAGAEFLKKKLLG